MLFNAYLLAQVVQLDSKQVVLLQLGTSTITSLPDNGKGSDKTNLGNALVAPRPILEEGFLCNRRKHYQSKA